MVVLFAVDSWHTPGRFYPGLPTVLTGLGTTLTAVLILNTCGFLGMPGAIS